MGKPIKRQETETGVILRNERGQYLPGTSGGPGRPKGRLSFKELIASLPEELRTFHHPDGGTLTPEQMVAARLLEDAHNGDPAAVRFIIDHICGKPVQPTENKNEQVGPVTLQFQGRAEQGREE